MPDNRVMKRMFAPKIEELTNKCKSLTQLYFSNITVTRFDLKRSSSGQILDKTLEKLYSCFAELTYQFLQLCVISHIQ